MSKLRVCVLFGGASSEHSISEISAAAVLSAIDRDKYEVYQIGITKSGKWFLFDGDAEQIRRH